MSESFLLVRRLVPNLIAWPEIHFEEKVLSGGVSPDTRHASEDRLPVLAACLNCSNGMKASDTSLREQNLCTGSDLSRAGSHIVFASSGSSLECRDAGTGVEGGFQ